MAAQKKRIGSIQAMERVRAKAAQSDPVEVRTSTPHPARTFFTRSSPVSVMCRARAHTLTSALPFPFGWSRSRHPQSRKEGAEEVRQIKEAELERKRQFMIRSMEQRRDRYQQEREHVLATTVAVD